MPSHASRQSPTTDKRSLPLHGSLSGLAIGTILIALVLFALAWTNDLVPASIKSGQSPAAWRIPPGPNQLRTIAPLPVTPYRLVKIAEHIEQPDASCVRLGAETDDSPYQKALGGLLARLQNSALAQELLATAEQRRVVLCLDWSTDLMAYYRSGLKLIALNPRLQRGALITYLAHELAHVPQHRTYSDNRYYAAQDLLLLRRMREAAAEAAAIRIAWQLREAGDPAPWDLKVAEPFYGDLAEAFAQTMTTFDDDAARNEARAARAAFDEWFNAPARIAVYDGLTLDHLQRISDDWMGLVPPRLTLSHDFLLGLTGTANEATYPDATEFDLTGPHYRRQPSRDNQRRLATILRRAGLTVAASQTSRDGSARSSDAAHGQDHTANP